MKDLEMGKLFCIVQVGPKCNHDYPYKREAEGEYIHMHGDDLLSSSLYYSWKYPDIFN